MTGRCPGDTLAQPLVCAMSISIPRRSFLVSAVGLLAIGPACRSAQRGASYDVSERSIGELQSAMATGEVSAAELVELYLNRIAAYDRNGPHLNAVLHLNPNATADARALDEERSRQGPRGPLHGIPVLLKDNFDTKDMPTTGASLALAGLVPREDAFQVRKLREAGAVLLGKVNLHELALGLTTVSSLSGQTLNPYDIGRAPGGSSGGSAVAAAASFAAFAMGTDTSGSIRIPSAHNALVGLRPSAGLSSRAGIIPFGHTQDTGGPMARTVTDIAIVLDATVGYDPADPTTAASRNHMPATYTAYLKPDALNGLVSAYCAISSETHPRTKRSASSPAAPWKRCGSRARWRSRRQSPTWRSSWRPPVCCFRS